MSEKIENNDNSNSVKDINGGAAQAEPPFVLSTENMDDVTRLAARKKAMEGECESLDHGSKIYFIAKGWESSTIESDPNVKVINTFLGFKEAFCDADIKTIFIPIDAIVTLSKMRKFCNKYAVSKAIYIEGERTTHE